MHEGLDLVNRELLLKKFRQGTIRFLICSDVFHKSQFRILEKYKNNLIINYDLPPNKETYVNRIGRTDILGRQGTAINFILSNDIQFLEQLHHI